MSIVMTSLFLQAKMKRYIKNQVAYNVQMVRIFYPLTYKIHFTTLIRSKLNINSLIIKYDKSCRKNKNENYESS